MRVPIVEWMKSYPLRYVGADILAGVVVAALAMPQALGYAGIAGVPVLVGLYSIPWQPADRQVSSTKRDL